MTGKEKCRALREIREKIARSNELDFPKDTCTHEGPCPGTCPKCEQEARQLEAQLQKRASLGKKIALAGLCAGMIAVTAGCSIVEEVFGENVGGGVPAQVDALTGDVELIMGEVPYEEVVVGRFTAEDNP